jgi:hypothetical protein
MPSCQSLSGTAHASQREAVASGQPQPMIADNHKNQPLQESEAEAAPLPGASPFLFVSRGLLTPFAWARSGCH